MKSTKQNQIKTGFTTTSGVKAGDCFGGCYVSGNYAIAYDCKQCPYPGPQIMVCEGNPRCNDGQPGGDNCWCL